MLPGVTVRPDRVAMYIRWSTEDQGEGTTLQVQREGCEHYILSQGWQINPDLIFVDDGYSGGTLDRPAMTRLRQAVHSGTVDCVVVCKLDRLSRSVLDTVRLVLEEWEGRCCLRSAREAVDTASPSGKMLFYLLVSYAEWERGTIRERTLAGKLKRAEAGRNPGFTPPYGLTATGDGGFRPVRVEAAAVQRAFAWCRAGLSCAQIALNLNAAGYRSRAGSAWRAAGVRRLLTNPAYAGELHYGRRPRGPGGRRRPLGPATVVCRGALPALVEPEAWREVQLLLAAGQGGAGRAAAAPHLLSGLGRCTCGAALRIRVRGGHPVYTCSQGPGHAPGQPHTPAVPAEALEAAVLGALRSRFGAVLSGPASRRAPGLDKLAPSQRKAVLRHLLAAVTLAPAAGGAECRLTWRDGPQRAGGGPA